MKHFILFVLGLAALLVLIGMIGPMILLGLGVFLLYFVFKQFLKADTTGGKIGWIVVGLLVLGLTIANMYALVGLVAAFALYLIYKEFKKDKPTYFDDHKDDSFMNFEKQWAELNK